MKTVQLQARPAGCEHWFNIPESMRESLEAQGFHVRELVVRPTDAELREALLTKQLAAVAAMEVQRHERARRAEVYEQSAHVDLRGAK